ncbi:MAG TPA: Ig-like domain-containing protein [Mycobacteriales bacterium]|jgi:hypothetical protein|nr:Ig-like domain-containing protein [Mycobacteriales bacterium]
MLRGLLLGTGGAAAVALGANPAFAGTLSVTYTGAANPTTNTPLTWSVSQNPSGPMSCELDYGTTVVSPLADCGPTVTYSVAGGPAGTYRLVAYGDSAVNVTGTTKTLSSSISVAPVAPTPSGPTGPSNDRAPQWALGLPSGATGACMLTSSTGTVIASADPCSSPWTGPLGSAADGTYTLSVVARQAGLTSTPGTLTYTLDTTAPSAAAVTSPAPIGNDRTPTFAIAGVEAGAAVSCTATGPAGAVPLNSCTTTSAQLALAGQPEGAYRLDVVVTDVAGNPSATASASYTLDVTPPPAPTVSTPPALTRQKSMTLTIGDAEAGTTLTCMLTSPTGSTVFSGACPANGTFDTTGFADGVYTLVVTAADAAGNTASTTVSWERDTTPPPVPVITGPTGPVNDRTPSLSVSDSEAGVTFDCAVAGSLPVTVTACGTTTTLDLTGATDGDYVVRVTATDAAGNSRSASFTLTLDTTAPPAPVTTGPTAPVNDRTPSLAVSDTEAGVTYSCTIVGPGTTASVTTCGTTTTLDLSTAADGDYAVTVTAADAAGNRSSSTFTVVLDTVAPPAPTVTTPRSPGQSTTPSFTVTDAEAGVTYVCSVSGPSAATVTSCGPTTRLGLTGADGVYTVTIDAVDAAGNVSSSTTATYVLDTTAPAQPTIGVTPSPAQGRHPSFTVSGVESGGVVTCTLSAPAGSTVTVPVSCAPGVSLDLTGQPDGRYTLTVTVTDAAGNVSVAGVATYVLDTTSPLAPAVTPPPNPSNDVTPTFDITTEPGATLTCTVERFFQTVWSGPCPADGTLDLSGYGDGEFEVTVFAADAAGNVGPSTTAAYLLDTLAPDRPVLIAPASPSPVTNPTWMWTAEAGATSTCTVTNSTGVVVIGPVACTSPWVADFSGLPDDTYTFSVVATDAAGNSSAAATSIFVLDRQAPIPPTVVPPASPDNDTTPTWQISGPRNAVLTCTLLQGRKIIWGPAPCPASGTFSLAGLPDGTYALRVTATDHAGNVSAASVTSYVLDTVPPPSPTLDYGTSSPSTDTSPFWGFTLPPGTSGRCELLRNGTVIASRSNCAGAVRFDLSGRPQGTYVVKIYAIDAAGNVSQPLVFTYVLGQASSVPPPSGATGTGATGGTPGASGRQGGTTPPPLPTAPGAARPPLDEINRLSSLIRSGTKHTVQKAEAAVSAVIPVIHDKITENVSHAVQGVVNAVSSAGGGTGFPLILLLVVLAFLLMQNRIDSRDPKLALASVAADDTVEFLPPPSRGGDR